MAIIDHLSLGLRKRASASATFATSVTSASSVAPKPTEGGISRLAEAVGPVVIVGGGPPGLRVAEELTMISFLSLLLIGGAAGLITALDHHLGGSGTVSRNVLIWLHIIAFWPLPLLLTFHVISSYAC